MPFRLSALPTPAQRILTRLDPSGETTALFRHATGNDDLQVQMVASDEEWQWRNEDGEPLQQVRKAPSYLVLARRVNLTLQACNIENENGSVLLSKGMDWPDFLEAWGKLPDVARGELVSAMVEVNPNWRNLSSGGALWLN